MERCCVISLSDGSNCLLHKHCPCHIVSPTIFIIYSFNNMRSLQSRCQTLESRRAIAHSLNGWWWAQTMCHTHTKLMFDLNPPSVCVMHKHKKMCLSLGNLNFTYECGNWDKVILCTSSSWSSESFDQQKQMTELWEKICNSSIWRKWKLFKCSDKGMKPQESERGA